MLKINKNKTLPLTTIIPNFPRGDNPNIFSRLASILGIKTLWYKPEFRIRIRIFFCFVFYFNVRSGYSLSKGVDSLNTQKNM